MCRCAGPEGYEGTNVLVALPQMCHHHHAMSASVAVTAIVLLLLFAACLAVLVYYYFYRRKRYTAGHTDVDPIVAAYNMSEESTYEFA